jgi:pimeloyl-ACP methyl ester carboxylesterase
MALLVGPCGGAVTPLLKEVHTVDRDDKPSELSIELDDGSTYSIECESYAHESGKITGTSLDVPVIRFSCGQPAGRKGIAVWLFGGPFAKLDEDGLLPEQLLLLELGYDLVVPLYPGSAERKYKVVGGSLTPDFQQAFDELAQVIAAVQQTGPLVLVGESFGAILALSSSKHLRSDDTLILVEPLLVSLKDAMVISGDPAALVLADRNRKKAGALDLPEGANVSINNRRDPNSIKLAERSDKASDFDEVALLHSYMKDWLYTSPLANFSNPNGAKVLVLAGDLDPVAKKDDIDKLVQLAGSNASTIVLRGQGHGGVRSLQEIDLLRTYLLSDDGAVPSQD